MGYQRRVSDSRYQQRVSNLDGREGSDKRMMEGREEDVGYTVRIEGKGSGIMTANMLETRSKGMGAENQEDLLD